MESSFFAEHTTFGYRSNYLLIAIKGVERIYEKYNSSGWQSVTAYVPLKTHKSFVTDALSDGVYSNYKVEITDIVGNTSTQTLTNFTIKSA